MNSKFKLQKSISFLSLFVAFFLLSCSGKPDIADLKSELQGKIKSQSNGDIELLEISKTNATDEEIFGQKIHNIFYTAKIQFTRECFMYVNKSGIGPVFTNFKTYSTAPEFVPSFSSVVTKLKKDYTFEFDGKATYLKTENGWILQN